MKIDAWWFENKQRPEEVLQTDWVIPKSHFGVYAETEKITFPLTLCVTAKSGNLQLYRREFEIHEPKEQTETYTVECSEYSINLKCTVKEAAGLPGEILVKIKSQEWEYQEQVTCAYARLHGRITDFDGNPFPAPLLLSRIGFADAPYMGVWSDRNGEYSVVVPTGCYNAFYVDDNSYGKSTLENWSWHMIVDRDEEHNFKVGNGEVYSLSVWPNNGGGSTLFFWFRPMILPSIKKEEYEIELEGSKRQVMDISPELKAEDITVTLNGKPLPVVSLQKIYETCPDYTMPSYLVQTERYNGTPTVGKQTVIVEYDTAKRGGGQSYIARSQGRCQYFYKDSSGLVLQ